jgi:hypothetical protein
MAIDNSPALVANQLNRIGLELSKAHKLTSFRSFPDLTLSRSLPRCGDRSRALTLALADPWITDSQTTARAVEFPLHEAPWIGY